MILLDSLLIICAVLRSVSSTEWMWFPVFSTEIALGFSWLYENFTHLNNLKVIGVHHSCALSFSLSSSALVASVMWDVIKVVIPCSGLASCQQPRWCWARVSLNIISQLQRTGRITTTKYTCNKLINYISCIEINYFAEICYKNDI